MTKENGAQIGQETGERKWTRRKVVKGLVILGVSVGTGLLIEDIIRDDKVEKERQQEEIKETGGFEIEKDGHWRTVKVSPSVEPEERTAVIKAGIKEAEDGCEIKDVELVTETIWYEGDKRVAPTGAIILCEE